LRELVRLIDKRQRKPIYTDFEDEMGDESEVALPGFTAGTDYAKFRAKAQAFLRAHQDHVAIHKLRMNRPLTVADLAELERMLVESGVGAAADIARAASESQGLGLFVRSLVGLDREAPRRRSPLPGRQDAAANQIEFVNLIVNHLTEHGVIDAALLYESPFIDITPASAWRSAARAARSILLYTVSRPRCGGNWARIARSASPTPLRASTSKTTTSARSISRQVRSMPIFSISSSVSRRPAVSITCSGMPST
jgi:hypothetical protein